MWSLTWNYTMESAGINIWSLTEDKNFPTPGVYQSSIVQQRRVRSHDPTMFVIDCLTGPILCKQPGCHEIAFAMPESRPGDRFCSLLFFLDSSIPSTPTQQCPVSLTGGLDILFRTEHWMAIYSLKSHETAHPPPHCCSLWGAASLRIRVWIWLL